MLRRDMTAGQAMQFLREHYEDEHDLHYLYVLEDEGRPAHRFSRPRRRATGNGLSGLSAFVP